MCTDVSYKLQDDWCAQFYNVKKPRKRKKEEKEKNYRRAFEKLMSSFLRAFQSVSVSVCMHACACVFEPMMSYRL